MLSFAANDESAKKTETKKPRTAAKTTKTSKAKK